MSRRTLRVDVIVMGEHGHYVTDVTLPASIIDARGEVLCTGAVSPGVTRELIYERGVTPLFVRIILPNGITETQSLMGRNQTWHDRVTFRIGDEEGTSNWMAWSAARLDMRCIGGALRSLPGMMDAWFQLWEQGPNDLRWRQTDLRHGTAELHSSSEAVQMHFDHGLSPRALVVRLDSDSSQIISLPRWPTRVLVTTVRTLSGAVKPKVVIGGYSAYAEAIMEYLRTGRLGAVETLLDPGGDLAHRLLYGKVQDPIAATAAAYYLLRKRDWERLPDQWLENLENWFHWIPDAPLIRAMSQIERGMPVVEASTLAVRTLSHFLDRGFPLFSEATWLLGDLLALAKTAERPLETRIRRTLGTMLAASRPAGLSFGFAGKAPNRPMAAKEAFELKQKQRGNNLLSEAAQEVFGLVDATVPQLPPVVFREESANRQLQIAAARLRDGLEILQSTSHQPVPGSTAKTLFLQQVFNADG